jgi:ubiquinone/menaquinone biosynthesis C-methylase UbiE
MTAHYTDTQKNYFEMRAPRRDDFIQSRRAMMFAPFIKPTDTVLDFGCGTGGILANLDCARKIGIEINPPSIEQARADHIEIHSDLAAIADQSIDIVISNHALEHTQNPTAILHQMRRVLHPDGFAILVVPSENPAGRRFHS